MVIYQTTNVINNKIYIGQDKNNNQNYLGSGNLIKKVIKKYGKENFIKEILCTCSTIDELNDKEKYYINKYQSTNKDIGYNIAVGGTDGVMLNRKHSEETKQKMRNSSLGKKKSEMHCKNIGLSKKGRIISEEERKRRSDFSPLKGVKKTPLSDDIKKKISESKKGKKVSKNTKEKMRISHLGNKNPFYGKKHSEEFMMTKRKRIKQLTINNDFIKEWESISEASKKLNIYSGNICKVLKGQYKTTGGYIFKYIEIDEFEITNN